MREPLDFYDCQNNIKFYLVDCGSGLTHLIVFPDGTTMLYDCNLLEDNKNEILDLFVELIPWRENAEGIKEQYIDIFVNSHRDTDHLRGLYYVNSRFPIHSIWDSGQSGANIDNAEYKYYMGLRNRLKQSSENNLCVPTPSNAVYRNIGGADIYVLADAKEYVQLWASVVVEYADKKQHTNCLVLLICYGGRKMLLTGDSDWKAWKENIVPNFEDETVNYEDTDILIASHHGSRTFFTNKEEIDEENYPDDTFTESIKHINPITTLISCGDYEQYHHPSDDALSLYEDYTSNSQVYTTRKYGTLCGVICKNGFFSVAPIRFYNYGGENGKRVILTCKTSDGEVVANGDNVYIGCYLYFKLTGIGGVLDDNTVVTWEVCNAGYNGDEEHHEIYYKSKDEKDGKYSFSRELSYIGTHLLRCRVRNRRKGFDQQIVFVVHGKKRLLFIKE